MYTHPWWIHWRSRDNDFLQTVLAASFQFDFVIPCLNRLQNDTADCPSWETVAQRLVWSKTQMERVRRRKRREPDQFERVTDHPFNPQHGGLAFGLLADLARFFGVEVTHFIPPLSTYYTSATRTLIRKIHEEVGEETVPQEVLLPVATVWAYVQYHLNLRSADPYLANARPVEEASLTEVLAQNGTELYFQRAQLEPFPFRDENDVADAVLQVRTVLDNLLSELESRDQFVPVDR